MLLEVVHILDISEVNLYKPLVKIIQDWFSAAARSQEGNQEGRQDKQEKACGQDEQIIIIKICQ